MSADIKPQPTPPTPIKPSGFHPKFWPVVIVLGLFLPLLFINPGQKQADKVKNNTVYSFSSSSSSQSSTSGNSSSNSGLFGFNLTWPSFSLPSTGQSVSSATTTSTTTSPTEVSGFDGVSGALGALFRPAEPLNNNNTTTITDGLTGVVLIGPDNNTMRQQDLDQVQDESIVGKIKFDPNAEFAVMSDKFQPGESVEIDYNGRRTVISVERGKILESDVYFQVNRQIFFNLGGNPDNGDVIEVTLIKV